MFLRKNGFNCSKQFIKFSKTYLNICIGAQITSSTCNTLLMLSSPLFSLTWARSFAQKFHCIQTRCWTTATKIKNSLIINSVQSSVVESRVSTTIATELQLLQCRHICFNDDIFYDDNRKTDSFRLQYSSMQYSEEQSIFFRVLKEEEVLSEDQ